MAFTCRRASVYCSPRAPSVPADALFFPALGAWRGERAGLERPRRLGLSRALQSGIRGRVAPRGGGGVRSCLGFPPSGGRCPPRSVARVSTPRLSRAPACFVLEASVCASVIVQRCARASVRECGSPNLGRLRWAREGSASPRDPAELWRRLQLQQLAASFARPP